MKVFCGVVVDSLRWRMEERWSLNWIWNGIKLSELCSVVQKITSKVQKRNVIMNNANKAVHQLLFCAKHADDTSIFSRASDH